MPDVRWCHPSIHPASHARRESRHVVRFRPCAVAPGAAVRQEPRRDPVARHLFPRARSHTWSRALRGARTFGACARIHEENLSRPLHGRHCLPSHRLLLRSSTAAVVGHHPWCGGIVEGSEMGHQRNQDRAFASAQHSRSAPGGTIGTTRRAAASRNSGTVVPHHLTPACSGLATLAADARR